MSRQLDADAAALLETRVREAGVRPIAGVRARQIETRDGQQVLSIDGWVQPLVADMIAMTAGIRPRDELARDAGLAVASGRGGIAVDAALRTTDPAIYAIGECASHKGVVYGLVAPGFRMAETLAAIFAGRPSRFRGYTPAVRLRFAGIEVWSLGDHAPPGTRVRWRGNGSHRQITLWGRRVIAAAAVGPWEEIGFAQNSIRHGYPLSPEQVHQFYRTGTFSRRTTRSPVSQWPESAIVCNCLEITQGALSSARAEGCSSVEALAARTGASTICGSCRPLLAELIDDTSSAAASKGRAGLVLAAAVAVALVLAIAGGAPLPPATSVQKIVA